MQRVTKLEEGADDRDDSRKVGARLASADCKPACRSPFDTVVPHVQAGDQPALLT
jgi:hypothetical protein